MRGDDHLALMSAQALATMYPGHLELSFSFLEPLRGLIVDEQRRLLEPAYVPTLKTDDPPKGKKYVAGLIRDLELVASRQMGQPGGVDLTDHPVTKALIQAGDDAVQPLLDCLENDTRLTRSVRFGRDFHPGRTILGVHEAAYAALASILQTSFFGAGSTADSLTAHGLEGRRQAAAAIRAYWQKNKALSLLERWHQTLSDDESTPDRSLEAADNIIQDADVDVSRSSMFGGSWTMTPKRASGTVPAMRGEALRSKIEPSVSDLLITRIRELDAPTGRWPDTSLRTKVQLALALAKWDGKNHFNALRAVSDVLKSRNATPGPSRSYEVQDSVPVFRARIKAGDPWALSDYAAWLPTVGREGLDFSIPTLFKIMWQHPTDPAIRQAAEKIFVDKDSPCVPLLNQHSGFVGDLFALPLVGLAAFRAELLRGLSDPAPAGSVTLDPKGFVRLQMTGGWQSGGGVSYGDPLAPAAGTLIPFRVCDPYAFEISHVEGAPRCELYWPEKNRDEAVARCTQFLRVRADLYQAQPGDHDHMSIRETAHVHFPNLDHPATQDEVEQSRAIFSLPAERRLVKLPTFPVKASWTTLRNHPSLNNEVDADGKPATRVDYFTDGKVFQAEEALVDGHWERFFGFVGQNHMEKVPAAEIEFSSGTMTRLTHGFECALLMPGTQDEYNRTQVQVSADTPLSVTLKIRNRSAMGQRVPGTMFQPPDDHRELPPAVTLTMVYTPKTDTEYRFVLDVEGQPVSLKGEVALAEAQPDGPRLAPTAECTVMTIDLLDFFDVTRPGLYRLQASMDDPDKLVGKSNRVEFIVASERVVIGSKHTQRVGCPLLLFL